MNAGLSSGAFVFVSSVTVLTAFGVAASSSLSLSVSLQSCARPFLSWKHCFPSDHQLSIAPRPCAVSRSAAPAPQFPVTTSATVRITPLRCLPGISELCGIRTWGCLRHQSVHLISLQT
ncbi:hypothetical protein PU46_22725 [Escherichia coli]|nr:hypothetical protein PU46_22725 [Escherichia coli]